MSSRFACRHASRFSSPTSRAMAAGALSTFLATGTKQTSAHFDDLAQRNLTLPSNWRAFTTLLAAHSTALISCNNVTAKSTIASPPPG